MSTRTKEEVENYVEGQCKCNVIHSKPEQSYNDLGFEVTVWNVKTDEDGSWWVVEGEGLPMNLYPQDHAYYFSTDEAYSFHLGLMTRLLNDESKEPSKKIQEVEKGIEISIAVRRKLTQAAAVLNNAFETEEIQSVGMICREALIVLGHNIFSEEFLEDGEEEPKRSDFKKRSRIAIRGLLPGGDNSELRDHLRKISNSAWDFANKITHSDTRTIYEASICLTLCTAVASSFENLLAKKEDPFGNHRCKKCGSRNFEIYSPDGKQRDTEELLIVCEVCKYGQLVTVD
jgi:hypothetical protein